MDQDCKWRPLCGSSCVGCFHARCIPRLACRHSGLVTGLPPEFFGMRVAGRDMRDRNGAGRELCSVLNIVCEINTFWGL